MLDRYVRQIVYSSIGKKGQKRLIESRVAILGLGALGTVAANYLARAGVNLTLIDRDFVELDNLQRHILFDEEDAKEKKPKALAAKEKLEKINSEIGVKAIVDDFNSRTAENYVKDADFVVDGTDNTETRFLLNEVCHKLKKPWVYGGVIGDHGVTVTFLPKGACLSCIYPKRPIPGELQTCETVGVLGPMAALIGALEAGEAIKYLVGFGKTNTNLVYFDLLDLSFKIIRIRKRKGCEVCEGNYKLLTKKEETFSTSLCGRNAIHITFSQEQLDLRLIEKKLAKLPECEVENTSNLILHLLYGSYKVSIFSTGRAIIKNCKDPNKAKGIVSKLLGL